MRKRKKKDRNPLLHQISESTAAFKKAHAPLDEGNKKGAHPGKSLRLSRTPNERKRDE